MLTSRFEICQPRYVPVRVHAILRIRGSAAHAQEETEELLRKILDHVNGPEDFGGWVRFHQVYQKLTDLPFVEGVEARACFRTDGTGSWWAAMCAWGTTASAMPAAFS